MKDNVFFTWYDSNVGIIWLNKTTAASMLLQVLFGWLTSFGDPLRHTFLIRRSFFSSFLSYAESDICTHLEWLLVTCVRGEKMARLCNTINAFQEKLLSPYLNFVGTDENVYFVSNKELDKLNVWLDNGSTWKMSWYQHRINWNYSLSCGDHEYLYQIL